MKSQFIVFIWVAAVNTMAAMSGGKFSAVNAGLAVAFALLAIDESIRTHMTR